MSDPINVYWWDGADNRNFGDVLNPFLVERISGRPVRHVDEHCTEPYYLVIGSVLFFANEHAIVWGSGILGMDQPIKRPAKIYAVRGPKTRERLMSLGIECPEVYGDPALLLPRLYTPHSAKEFALGIIPHFTNHDEAVHIFGHIPGIKIINILDPFEKVIEEIHACERTISSSLHGIIVSHAYSVPSVWMKLAAATGGDDIKFADYFLSVGIEPYAPLTDVAHTDAASLAMLVDAHPGAMPHVDLDVVRDRLMDACPFRT